MIQENVVFGHDPFIFDDRSACDLEAKILGSVTLTYGTWKTHSTDHKNKDRTYFAEFRENREAIIETLKNPESVRKIADQFGANCWFQRLCQISRKTSGGSIIRQWLPLTVIVGKNNMVKTFYPSKKIQTRGEVLYP